MNFHTDEWVMKRMQEHWEDALTFFPEDRIVCLCCQGSTNYGLDTKESDVDTKLIVLPSWEDIVFAKDPISKTYIRANEEHIDFKDIRLMFKTFRKQNINFLEILFTKYRIINPKYAKFWEVIDANRELIAHYDTYRALSTMRGMAYEKYHAMEHPYPSKIELIKKYGYDGKQLSHMVRLEEFITRYIKGVPYAECLISTQREWLVDLKLNKLPLTEARELAATTLKNIENLVNLQHSIEKNIWVDKLLDNVLENILRIYLANEFNNMSK